MPMQWTLANERLLFLRILELSNTTVDYKKVAETWPNPDEKPTPRAVSEHVFKLKKLAKAGASGATTPAALTPKTPRTKTTTPRASGASRGGASGSTAKTKRKRDAAEDSEAENKFKPVKPARFKKEEEDDDDDYDLGPLQETPSKRASRPVRHLNMAVYAESGTEGDDESARFSSVDPEYAPPVDDEDMFQMPGADV